MLVLLTALALEFCFWLCLSCRKPYLLLHFDSIMWPQLGSGYALFECSVGSCNGLGSVAWILLSLGAQGMAVWLCQCAGAQDALKMLGQSSSLLVGISQLPEEIFRLLVQRFTTETWCSRLLPPAFLNTIFLIIDCVKAKSVVFNLTRLGFAFKGTNA